MNYNLEPKARALKDSAWAREHRKLIEGDIFETSAQIAMAQYVLAISGGRSLKPSERAHKIAGAHEFLATLRNLAEKAEAPKIVDETNLGQNMQ